MNTEEFMIRSATVADVPVILELIKDLATYERAPDEVVADEKGLAEVLFGRKPAAEVLLGKNHFCPPGTSAFTTTFVWAGMRGWVAPDPLPT